jgi:Skp family chaperone for outer membrane proteins
MRFGLARAVSGAIVLALCATVFAAPAMAAPAAADKTALVPTILIVDLPQVLRGSKAGKGVQTALGEESQTYSKEVARQEDDLQRMRSDLERQRTVLSQAAYEAKAKAFQLHLKELDTAVQAKRQAMQKAYYDAMSKIEAATRDVIANLAKERGANLVVLKQAVILSPDASDVTNEVLARLDKNLASVPINMPKADATPHVARKPTPKTPPGQKFNMDQ